MAVGESQSLCGDGRCDVSVEMKWWMEGMEVVRLGRWKLYGGSKLTPFSLQVSDIYQSMA